MRVIKAERGIYIPADPSHPANGAMRLVQTGIMALIPDDFELPKDAYIDLGKLDIRKDKRSN